MVSLMRRMWRAAGSGGARSGLHHRNALRAQRTGFGRIRIHHKSVQCRAWNAKVHFPSAAVDDGAGGQDTRTLLAQALNDFARATAGGDDVFDDHGSFARRNLKSPAQLHLTRRIPLGENESCSQSACYLVADDEAADGGRRHQADTFWLHKRGERFGQPASQILRDAGMLEYQRALQICGTMEAAGQAKMAGEVCARRTKQIQNCLARLGLRHHKRLLYHWRTEEQFAFCLRNFCLRGTSHAPFSAAGSRGLHRGVAPAAGGRTVFVSNSGWCVESFPARDGRGSVCPLDESVSAATRLTDRPL